MSCFEDNHSRNQRAVGQWPSGFSLTCGHDLRDKDGPPDPQGRSASTLSCTSPTRPVIIGRYLEKPNGN